MIIKEAELFEGLSQDTMSKISEIMMEESYSRGAILFNRGDPADNFYVLVIGKVRLAIGEKAELDYTVSQQGEAFGWSSLAGRDKYTATAECMVPSQIIRIERDRLMRILERNPESGMIFFRRLAGAIGERLLFAYNAYLDLQSTELDQAVSFGSGQVASASDQYEVSP